jgi:ACS family hexuronate transporter-like MFS transporter
MNPYAGRMRAMLIFAFFPLLALVAQPAGSISYWLPVLIIGVAGAAHQAWSAIFSTVGDMFPKKQSQPSQELAEWLEESVLS